MKYFNREEVEKARYDEFVPFLISFYTKDVTTPARPHYKMDRVKGDTLLVMPAWTIEDYVGVKLLTILPENSKEGRDTIQGIFVLMDRDKGNVLCTIDGAAMTALRTAAISAAAGNRILERPRTVMTMVGTGRLSYELIRAHSAMQPLKEIYVWGRNFRKAQKVAETLIDEGLTVTPVEDLSRAVGISDLVSVATLSKTPLILESMLGVRCHLDLVGTYTTDAQEAESECLADSQIFVDHYSAMETSGDLVTPLKSAVIKTEDVLADMKAMCKPEFKGVSHERTVFKSVGNAQSDLALAVYLYEQTQRIHY